jgi:hypothetical protein
MAFITTTDEHIASGGTITGDITIKGDLTVEGDGSGTYDEIIEGNLQVGNSSTADSNIVIESSSSGDPKLQFTATANRSGLIDFVEGSTLQGAIVYKHNGDTLGFSTGSTNRTERFVVNETSSYFTSNVLVGLTTADALLDAAITPALQVEGTTSSGSSLSIFRNDNGSSGPYLILGKSRGTSIGSDTVVQDNDQLGQIAFVGADGTDRITPGARIFARVNGTPGSNDLPTELVFETTADGASATTERMVINSSGNIGIGTAPAQPLHIKSATPSILFEDTTNGYLAYVGDAQDFLTGSSPAADSFGIRSEGDIRLGTGGNNLRMVIDSSGNFLMGHATSMNSGGNTPKLQVSNNNNDAAIGVYNYGSNAAHFASLRLAHSKNGTIGSHTVLADNDKIGTIEFNGSDGTNFDTIGARIIAEVDGTPASNRMPSALTFSTAAGGSDDDVTERMRIDSSGDVGIGTDSPDKLLHLKSSGSESPCLKIENNNDDQYPPRIQFVKDVGNDAEADYDQLGSISFRGQDTNNNLGTFTQILGKSLDVTDSTEDGQLIFNVMKANDGDGVQVFIDPVGMDIYGTPLKVFGANTGHETSALCMGQDTSALSQIRAYGADDSTAGTLEFRMTSSAGAVNQGVMKLDVNSRISLSNNDSGTDNTVFGFQAGAALASGAVENTIIGDYAATSLTTGDYNTAIGKNALYTEDVGRKTTAVGYGTLYAQNTASEGAVHNTAVGADAGSHNVTGTNNTWVGSSAGTGASGQSNSYNTGIGSNALLAVTSGSNNVAIGNEALKANEGGQYNIAIGHQSMLVHTGGLRNIAIGAFAMKDTDAGSPSKASDDCVLIGYNAGGGTWVNQDCSNLIGIGTSALAGALEGDTADGAVAIGKEALTALTSGASNTAVGYQSAKANNTGYKNTALGYDSFITNSTGYSNTAIGSEALYYTNSDENVAVGDRAGGYTTGDANTYVGFKAGFGASGAENYNTGVGWQSLLKITDGGYNVSIGSRSGEDLTTGDFNVFIGDYAGHATVDGDKCIAIGHSALAANVTSAGDGTIAIGYSAGGSITSGAAHLAIGFESLRDMTTGSSNVAVGYYSQRLLNHADADCNVTVGNYTMDGVADVAVHSCTAIGHAALSGSLTAGAIGSTAVGRDALNSLTSGAGNTAVGYQSLNANVDGGYNTAVGYQTLLHFEADSADHGDNTALGNSAGKFISTGTQNTMLGNQAGLGITGTKLTGDGNTCVGASAGIELEGAAHSNTFVGKAAGNTTEAGVENTCIGFNTEAQDDTATNQIVIGNNLTGTKDNAVFIGNDSSHIENDFNSDATWNHSSDRRQKTDIKDETLGLEFINDLRPVTYKHKSPSEFPEEWDAYDADDKEPMGGDKTIHGFIAQEVKEAMDNAGVDTFQGWSDSKDGRQRVSFEAMVMPLIKSVQELSSKVEDLEKQLKDK